MKQIIILLFFLCSILFSQNYWVKTNLFKQSVKCLSINANNVVFAGTDENGIYRSSDNGNNWTNLNNGLAELHISSVTINSDGPFLNNLDGDIFVGTRNGVFCSMDNGDSWSKACYSFKPYSIKAFVLDSIDNIFAGSWGDGIFFSGNYGTSWHEVNNGLTSTDVTTLAINSNGDIFAGTNGPLRTGNGVYKSDDNGDSWSMMKDNVRVFCIEINPKNEIYVGTEFMGIFKSTDKGDSWTQINNGLPESVRVTCLKIDSDNIIYAGTNNGIYYSTNNGDSWSNISSGLSFNNEGNICINTIEINSEGYIFIGTSDGVFRSNLNYFPTDDVFANLSNIQFITEEIGFGFKRTLNNGISSYGLCKTTDGGISWNLIYKIGDELLPKTTNKNNIKIWCGNTDYYFTDEHTGYFCLNGNVIYKTTNGGNSWSLTYKDTNETFLNYIKFCNENIGVASHGGSDRECTSSNASLLLYTIDGGQNWEKIDVGSSNSEVLCIQENNTMFLKNVKFKGDSVSTKFSKFDMSDSIWYDLSNSLPNFEFKSIDRIYFVNNEIGFMVAVIGYDPKTGYLYQTTDGGSTWSIKNDFTFYNNINENKYAKYSYIKFFTDSLGIIAGDSWIKKTNDGGINFELVTDNSPILRNTYCFIDDKIAYGINSESELMKTTNSGKDWSIIFPTSIKEQKYIANDYRLYQNYPNPFNPSTTIKYSIPHNSGQGVGTSHDLSLQLKIYDVLGSEIATLVNKQQKPGYYEVTWNAGNQTSGIYFYKLSVGSFASTKKMILLR